MKTVEVRCLQERKTKRDRGVKCGRFLLSLDEYTINVPCPNCGSRYTIAKGENGETQICPLPSRKPLISKEQGINHGS